MTTPADEALYEQCSYCKQRYPAPVGLHHTQEECVMNQKGDEALREPEHYFWCELHKKAHRQGDDKRECLLVGPFAKENEATAWGGGSEP